MKTAKDIIKDLPLNVNDIARLTLEATEELGEAAQGRERTELILLLRRVIRAGVKAVQAEEHTVSFEEAAWASVEARAGRRASTLRDLRHFVRRMLRVQLTDLEDDADVNGGEARLRRKGKLSASVSGKPTPRQDAEASVAAHSELCRDRRDSRLREASPRQAETPALGVGGLPLRSMTTAQCRRILHAAFGCSDHSFNKGRAILHSIFAYGLRQEWCGENPVSRIEPRRIREKEIVPLSPQEVQRLEQAAQLPEHREMRFSLHLLLYNGVRPQEVARLNERHIRPEQGRVIIPAAGSKTGGGRVLPLRKVRSLRGVPLRIPRNWQNRWRALRRAAGFSAGHWQADVCRHTFASYHAAYFRDLGALQLEMGHRSTDLLRSRYLNLPQVKQAKEYWNIR